VNPPPRTTHASAAVQRAQPAHGPFARRCCATPAAKNPSPRPPPPRATPQDSSLLARKLSALRCLPRFRAAAPRPSPAPVTLQRQRANMPGRNLRGLKSNGWGKAPPSSHPDTLLKRIRMRGVWCPPARNAAVGIPGCRAGNSNTCAPRACNYRDNLNYPSPRHIISAATRICCRSIRTVFRAGTRGHSGRHAKLRKATKSRFRYRARAARTDIRAIRGHTPFTGDGVLYCGDIPLFSCGCGAPVRGHTGANRNASLSKLADLPAETLVYCGHEIKSRPICALPMLRNREILPRGTSRRRTRGARFAASRKALPLT